MKFLRQLFRPKFSDLAIETYERQVSLAERQETVRKRLELHWSGRKEKTTPHHRFAWLELYSPAQHNELHFEYGPVSNLKEASHGR